MSIALAQRVIALENELKVLKEAIDAIDERTRKRPAGRPTTKAAMPLTDVIRETHAQ